VPNQASKSTIVRGAQQSRNQASVRKQHSVANIETWKTTVAHDALEHQHLSKPIRAFRRV